MTAATLKHFMPYGAPELQEAARPNLVRALALGSLLASLVFTLAWSLSLMFAGSRAAQPHSQDAIVLMPEVILVPPSIQVREPRPVSAKPPNVVAARPVPVKETAEPNLNTVANQDQLRADDGGTRAGGPPVVAAAPPTDGVLPKFGKYIYTDVLPEPITPVEPIYPPIALQAQVDGLVMVHVLIGKEGHVLDVRLDAKKNVPMLNQAALDAARKWVFTPALSNNHPVPVWAAIPFRFKLN